MRILRLWVTLLWGGILLGGCGGGGGVEVSHRLAQVVLQPEPSAGEVFYRLALYRLPTLTPLFEGIVYPPTQVALEVEPAAYRLSAQLASPGVEAPLAQASQEFEVQTGQRAALRLRGASGSLNIEVEWGEFTPVTVEIAPNSSPQEPSEGG